MISPLAYVDPSAKIGKNVEIRPFAYIEGNVEIGDDCVIMSNACILEGTVMGRGNRVYQNAVIGSIPQDLHYVPGTPGRVVIGNGNAIRENVVIARSLTPETATVIGEENHLMNKVHVCHDVRIGNHTVLGISVSVAPECSVGDCAILSSACVVQHSVRIGKCSLLQSGCRVQKDVLPYAIFGGNPASFHGVNKIVLKHVNPELDERRLRHINNAFRLITAGNFSLEDAVIKIHEQIAPDPEIEEITDFISTTRHGIIRHVAKED